MKTKTKGLEFREWLDEMGPDKVAKMLHVNISTISHWKRGRAFPTIKNMKLIKEFTNGRVGYTEIIESTPDTQKRYPHE